MTQLWSAHCTEANSSISLTAEQVANYKQLLDNESSDWQIVEQQLVRSYQFQDFSAAFQAVEKVAAVAEAEGHHPDISFGWGYLRVSIWTHSVKGLTEADFILAAKIERAVKE